MQAFLDYFHDLFFSKKIEHNKQILKIFRKHNKDYLIEGDVDAPYYYSVYFEKINGKIFKILMLMSDSIRLRELHDKMQAKTTTFYCGGYSKDFLPLADPDFDSYDAHIKAECLKSFIEV